MFRRWMASRTWILIVGAVAIFALVMLSAGLTDVRFGQPGEFSFEPRKPTPLVPLTTPSQPNVWLVRLIVIVTLLATVGLVIALFDKRARRLFLKFLLYAALFLIISYILPSHQQQPAPTATAVPAAASGELLQGPPATPYTDPEISPLVAYFAALLLVLIGMGAAWYLWNRRTASAKSSVLQGIRRIAEYTRDELSSGLDWRDAVIRCYVQMTEAVASEKGLVRRPSMTAEEFAGRLTQAGLPMGSVHRLTQLFESARYGGKRSSQTDVDEARACLNEIVAASGGAG
jgi:hypothetical protein